jgi:hypothetical protein
MMRWTGELLKLYHRRELTMSADQARIDVIGLRAATEAVEDQLCSEARSQGAYLHRFDDGKVSLELEWIDPAELARAALAAYLRHALDLENPG